MAAHLVGKNALLMLIAMLEEFLDHIVAKDICHKLQGIGLNFSKDLFFFVTVGRFELLLDEPRAMLITTKLDNMPVDVLFQSVRVLYSIIKPYLELVALACLAV